MAKILISYSRVDEPFVRRLDQALRDHGHETWIDLTGIPASAVFMEEIYAAIESSDAFVFVLSPESAASEFCKKELRHAVSHNKRLIPIVRREVVQEVVRHEDLSALADRQWIPLQKENDFDASLVTLLGAIATDLDWVRDHTRLTVRAAEWERRRRNSSVPS